MYGADLTEIHDLIHESRGKDYAAEAHDLTRRVRALRPDADSLLDVACGTGAHLRHFGGLFDRVAGLELSEPMVRAARRALPDVPVHTGDLRDFRLETRFDVITCLFGSLGYATDAAELHAALAAFARHLTSGGVVAVDPWWFPETYLDGYVSGDVATVAGRTVARVSHSARAGDACRMDVHYVVADARTGVRHFTETHRISLFPRATYEAAFRAAGLDVTYVPGLYAGRGLFLGTAPVVP
ncbi:bifunctional 2-polyprenyl-6-hydroxyphenol methylase/3-demethylubiquinol 3-O-methyltransferase UbiG [Kitasatospora sp. SUK 42]|uniref:class I SAM-dependent methyltransferase n=1 Tax=Kitasatospora sp. SUK 42 TaxID=1588882 RepID=UPI0018CBCA3F|nr:class I SAM-dependent methyltransferase [Kitasatospora sp. SUK 42]MBV2153222.1 class I SAM-dependent methyltransferase [Kitasatospora sp. SUK 42]